ncbi:MAG TPA: STAS domain-containing protein [Acidimicrobiales bacterium]|nr:STAS domain-containing protein [Acidimicrobiales bacterium]
MRRTIDLRSAGESGPAAMAWVDSADGTAVFRLHGFMDAIHAATFRRALAPSEFLADVLLDLSGIVYLDMVGLGVLAGAIRRVQEAGGHVTLVGAKGGLVGQLRRAGIYRLLLDDRAGRATGG